MSSVICDYVDKASQTHAVLPLSTSSCTVIESESMKGYVKPAHTWGGCNEMEDIGTCVVLSQQRESMCRLQAEDTLIIKFVVTS